MLPKCNFCNQCLIRGVSTLRPISPRLKSRGEIGDKFFALERSFKVARPKGNWESTEARRTDILQSAFDVFSNNGYNGGSLKKIAKAVGISEPGILHHFSSKSELLSAVLRYRDLIGYEIIHPDATTGVDFVRDWIKLVEYNISIPGIIKLYCILSAEATAEDHPAHEYFKERYHWVLGLTLKAFQKLKDEGRLNPGLEPLNVARALTAMSDGLQVQWLLNPTWSLVEEHRGFFRAVLTEEAAHLTGVYPVQVAI